MKNVVVVQDVINLVGEEGVELVSSNNYFEVDIDDSFKGERTVYGIKCGKRQGPESELLGDTYGSGEMYKFGESALGM